MRNRFFNKRGETLLESIISILVFSLIILTVSTMNSVSVHIVSSVKDLVSTYSKSQQLAEEQRLPNTAVNTPINFTYSAPSGSVNNSNTIISNTLSTTILRVDTYADSTVEYYKTAGTP